MKLKKWVKSHSICPAFKQVMDGCVDDADYYNRVEEPEYFIFGVSERNKVLCTKVLKASILKSVKSVEDEDAVFHIKKACLKTIPSTTVAWFETKKAARQLTTLERAVYKFILWKRGVTKGQIAGAVAVLLIRANEEAGDKDAKKNFMAYLRESISYKQWSAGLDSNNG
jgi:hypothetical protein